MDRSSYNLLTFALLVVAIFIFSYILFGFITKGFGNQPSGSIASTTIPQSTVTQKNDYLDNCTHQVNLLRTEVVSRLPKGSGAVIANAVEFASSDPQSVSNARAWAESWDGSGMQGGGESTSIPYSDISIASNRSMDITGVVLNINVSSNSGKIVFYDPLICGNGGLLPNSANYIKGV